jgi:hypothetical protein
MKRKISEIPPVRYGYVDNGVGYSCEPSPEDIQHAINNNQLEERGFQSHLEELKTEWRANAKTRQECDELVKIYHARRIAFFVVNGWKEPVALTAEGKVNDGLHRIKAAIFIGMDEVEVIILK